MRAIIGEALKVLPMCRRSEVLAQCVELFEQRLIECVGKVDEPVTNRSNIGLRLLQENASDVFQITGVTCEHLVHDKVFDGGKSDVGGTDVDNSGSGDGVAFIRRERKMKSIRIPVSGSAQGMTMVRRAKDSGSAKQRRCN